MLFEKKSFILIIPKPNEERQNWKHVDQTVIIQLI